jgi:hypothetical protein
MKIILEGLKMRSEIMDWPENSNPFIKIALSQPLTTITGYDGKKIGEIPPLATMAEFEWTGKYYPIGDDTKNWPRVYQLRDIYKQ